MPRPLSLPLTHFLLPAAIYFALYYALSYPLLHAFNSVFFCGHEDGFQNIWNLWWTNKAVTELGTHPWFTPYLHHPTGTTLIAHTLAPFNGFVGVLLFKLGLSLHQVYNTIVVFSFVMTGVTAFWLALRVTGHWFAALFAGAAFTFSHFHFAHAQNHLQMVTLEWMPLATLAVYELLTAPRVWKALAAAGAMFLVALSDFHLTFYVVVAGSVLGLIVLARQIRGRFDGFRPYVLPLILFVTLTTASTGLLAYRLLHTNKTDPLQHNHDPVVWSTDVVDPIVPSAQWRFNEWTRFVWGKLAEPGKDFVYVEHSLYVGWSLILLCAYAAWRARALAVPNLGYWFILLVLFVLLSMGPKLHVWGTVTPVPLPYRGLEAIFPPLKMGGVPMRLMVMAFLAASVIGAVALADLVRLLRTRAIPVVALLLALWAFENLPKAQPTTPAGYPFWVTQLRALPPGAVIDTTYKDDMSRHLYFATGHGHPVGEGYISRYPKSVEENRGRLRALVDAEQWRTLAGPDWNFRYLVVKHHVNGLKALVQDGDVRVYELPK